MSAAMAVDTTTGAAACPRCSGGVVRIGIRQLEARLGVERSTIWRWYKGGKFPAPHYLGDARVWFLADVEAWEAQQMARPTNARRGAVNLHHHDQAPQDASTAA